MTLSRQRCKINNSSITLRKVKNERSKIGAYDTVKTTVQNQPFINYAQKGQKQKK